MPGCDEIVIVADGSWLLPTLPLKREVCKMNVLLHRSLPLALGMAIAAFAPLAMAQAEMSQSAAEEDAGTASFAELDSDQSGSLSKAEIAGDSTLATYFANYDTDGNGELSPKEFRYYAGKNSDLSEQDAIDVQGLHGEHEKDGMNANPVVDD